MADKNRFESKETQTDISTAQSDIITLNNKFVFGVTEGTQAVPANSVVSFDIPRVSGMTKIFIQPVAYTNPDLFSAIVLAVGSSVFAVRVKNSHSTQVAKSDWRVFWMQTK